VLARPATLPDRFADYATAERRTMDVLLKELYFSGKKSGLECSSIAEYFPADAPFA
jgi:hypothetical protein